MRDNLLLRTAPLFVNTMMPTGVRILRYFVNGLAIVFLVIHFFVKDRIVGLSLIYYSMPLPVLAILLFIFSILWLLSKQIRFAKFYIFIAMACLMVWFFESFSQASGAQSASNLRLFFWNAARPRSKAEEVAKYIQGFHAGVIGIVEAGMKKKGRQNQRVEGTWRNEFASYTVEILPYDMALITKGKILTKASGTLARRGHYNLIKISLNGERFYVLLVDLDADPSQSRAPAFAQLAKLIRSYSQGNLIVMGDFNTPVGSILFEPFRQYLDHTFESGGVGFAETWPIPLPVLTIDQIWVSKKIGVASCRLNWSRLSDHRSVVADIKLPWPGHLQTDEGPFCK